MFCANHAKNRGSIPLRATLIFMVLLKTDSKPELVIQQIEDLLTEAGLTLEFSTLHLILNDGKSFMLVDIDDPDSGEYGFYGGNLPRSFDSERFRLQE